MNSRYLIYCCSGTGGLFLATVLAQVLGYPVQSTYSSTGHAHDMGQGNWKGTEHVCVIGDHWQQTYQPGRPIYYSHVLPTDFIQQNPDIKLIMITADSEDYRKVAELFVCKAWPDMWTKQEYAKWASPEYPPYSRDNIRNSDLIRLDLINDLEITTVKKWHDDNAGLVPHAVINFKTVMGINGHDVVDAICNITNMPAADTIRQYTARYQQLNQRLYFNSYAKKSQTHSR
jgi:hypothetical protein